MFFLQKKKDFFHQEMPIKKEDKKRKEFLIKALI